mmetsp:Transcript_23164/g.57643  ORF Transcript_23164/g.57643 Transcript_23164/m.57643 type:complete len:243 (+) Transcript_23164:376-1104(+)
MVLADVVRKQGYKGAAVPGDHLLQFLDLVDYAVVLVEHDDAVSPLWSTTYAQERGDEVREDDLPGATVHRMEQAHGPLLVQECIFEPLLHAWNLAEQLELLLVNVATVEIDLLPQALCVRLPLLGLISCNPSLIVVGCRQGRFQEHGRNHTHDGKGDDTNIDNDEEAKQRVDLFVKASVADETTRCHRNLEERQHRMQPRAKLSAEELSELSILLIRLCNDWLQHLRQEDRSDELQNEEQGH